MYKYRIWEDRQEWWCRKCVWVLSYTELRKPELLAIFQCRMKVEYDGAAKVTIAPSNFMGCGCVTAGDWRGQIELRVRNYP